MSQKESIQENLNQTKLLVTRTEKSARI